MKLVENEQDQNRDSTQRKLEKSARTTNFGGFRNENDVSLGYDSTSLDNFIWKGIARNPEKLQ